MQSRSGGAVRRSPRHAVFFRLHVRNRWLKPKRACSQQAILYPSAVCAWENTDRDKSELAV
eukprot:7122010-Pyramimonas_sp.AAC.1